MNLKGNERILDVGCGIGTIGKMVRPMLGRGGEIVGIDLDKELIEYGNEHWAKWSNIRLEIGDANHIKYDNSCFDIVSSFGILEFVSNMPQVVSEMFRVLRRPGKLVAICINTKYFEFRPWERKFHHLYKSIQVASELAGVDLGLTRFRAWCHDKALPLETFTFTMEYSTRITKEYIKLVEASMHQFYKSPSIIEEVTEFNFQFLKLVGWSKSKVRKYVNHQYSVETFLNNLRAHVGEEVYRKTPISIYRIQLF